MRRTDPRQAAREPRRHDPGRRRLRHRPGHRSHNGAMRRTSASRACATCSNGAWRDAGDHRGAVAAACAGGARRAWHRRAAGVAPPHGRSLAEHVRERCDALRLKGYENPVKRGRTALLRHAREPHRHARRHRRHRQPGAVAEPAGAAPDEPGAAAAVALLNARRGARQPLRLMHAQRWTDDLPTNAAGFGSVKTADIQQTLAYGAHGPKELLVLVIGDASRRAAGLRASPTRRHWARRLVRASRRPSRTRTEGVSGFPVGMARLPCRAPQGGTGGAASAARSDRRAKRAPHSRLRGAPADAADPRLPSPRRGGWSSKIARTTWLLRGLELEAEVPRQSEHRLVLAHHLADEALDADLARVAHQLVHQDRGPGAGALEVGTDDEGELGGVVVRVGHRARNAQVSGLPSGPVAVAMKAISRS